MDAFWQAGIDAGYRDDGAPGPRTIYGPDYYGGFLLDPDGNGAEAMHTERENPRRPLTERVHLAFGAKDDAPVRAFHAAALAAGYEDHGGPGERAVYHPTRATTARSSGTPTGTTSRSSTTTAEPRPSSLLHPSPVP